MEPSSPPPQAPILHSSQRYSTFPEDLVPVQPMGDHPKCSSSQWQQRASRGEHIREALKTISAFTAVIASITNNLDLRPGNLLNLQKQFNFLDYTQRLMACVRRSGNTEKTIIYQSFWEPSESPCFADYDSKLHIAPEAHRKHRACRAHVNPEVPPKGAPARVHEWRHGTISTVSCSILLWYFHGFGTNVFPKG